MTIGEPGAPHFAKLQTGAASPARIARWTGMATALGYEAAGRVAAVPPAAASAAQAVFL